MTGTRLSFVVLAAFLTLVTTLALTTFRIVQRGDALAVQQAEQSVTQAAEVARSVLNRHLVQVDGQLASLGELLDGRFLQLDQPDRVMRALREMTAHSYTLSNLMLTNAEGRILATGIAGQDGERLALPGWALMSDGPSLVGPMPDPRGGEQALFMLRRITPEQGAIFAVAKIRTSLFASVLAPMLHPPGLRIRLEDADGLILASGPGQTHLVGTTLPPPARELRRDERVERSPNRQGTGDVFGASRALTYPGLFAVAVLHEEAAMGDWPKARTQLILGSLALNLLLLALAAAIFASLRIRLRATAEREAANARLRAAIESLPDGFALWNAQDRLVIFNARYRDLVDPAGNMLVPAMRYEDLVRARIAQGMFSKRDLPVETLVARMLESHRHPGEDLEREMADGRWLRIAQQRVAEGGVVVILSDITALKRAMGELAEARDAADRETAAKSRLLAHVSHELRTPLAGLLRLADRLAEEPSVPPAQRRQVAMVGATGRHLLALANEVLDLAAMEAGSLALNPAPAEPEAVLGEALAMVQPLADGKLVELSFVAAGLPERLMLDATRLRQMVLNLLANAVKFTPAGSRVRLEARATGEMLRIEVTDQGRGVPEAERARLFTDFTRLHPGEAEGTGLGLSITARLAALMDGRIGCGDAPEAPGAQFWLEIPLVRPLPDAAAPLQPLEERRLRLLAVDDAPSNLSVLRALLATTGFDLEAVTDGRAALEAVEVAAREGRPFDAVLMDVMMPGMDGLETTRRLRALPGALGAIPVIAVTASAFPEDIAACRDAGMVDHVSKPVDRAVLLRVLAAHVAPVSGDTAPGNDLAALRPLFVAELAHRMRVLENPAQDGQTMLEALHAMVGTVGHLGEQRLLNAARAALRALRDGAPEAPGLIAALLAELRAAYPEAVGSRAA